MKKVIHIVTADYITAGYESEKFVVGAYKNVEAANAHVEELKKLRDTDTGLPDWFSKKPSGEAWNFEVVPTDYFE